MSDTTAAPDEGEQTPNPYEIVRARTKTHETSVRRLIAEQAGFEVLEDKAATDVHGYPLPDKVLVDKAGKPVSEGLIVDETTEVEPVTSTSTAKASTTSKEK